MFLLSVPKSPSQFPYVFFCAVYCSALVFVDDSSFASLGSLSLGAITSCLFVFVPLKCTWKPCLLHVLLNISPKLGMYGMTMEMVLLCLLLLFFLLLLLGCPSVLLLSLLLLFKLKLVLLSV